MKTVYKLFTAFALIFGLYSGTASAQNSVQEEEKYPHLFIGGAGGGFFQLNEKGYDIKNVFTPAGAFNLGGMFNPYVGMRFQFSGWKEKGRMTRLTSPRNYKYGFYSPNLDAMVDLTNIFYKKKPHVFHAYAIGGVGIAAGRGRQVESDGFTSSGHSRFTVDYRAGLQLEARIKNRIGIFVEGLAINMHDHNRPQLGEAGEWRIQTMLGLNFHLGGKKRVAKPAPVATPIPTPAKPEPAAEPVKKEEPKAKPKLEPKPQPQSQPAPVLEKRNAEIFFSIGSSKVSSAQEANVAAFAEWLNNHPKARVVNVTGYADAGTGTAAINKRVSRQRAEAVVRMLVDKYGIAADRIDENAVGDTVQPYAENDRNRVVIATAEEK